MDQLLMIMYILISSLTMETRSTRVCTEFEFMASTLS